MWSTGTRSIRKKEIIEAVVAISIMLLFEFAAPAIALFIGTMGIGDILAAATFAAGFGAGVAFWGICGKLWLHNLLRNQAWILECN